MESITSQSKLGFIPSFPKKFQYACAIAGMLCPLTLFVSFPAAGFLPPAGPTWTPERTVEHYRNNEGGVHAASILLLLSGLLYLPFTAALSVQLRRIPDLHPIFSSLQLAAGATASITFMVPGMILAVITYRLDRPAEITQAFSDFYWITVMMPWPPFLVQNFAFAFGVFLDNRAKPLFPKRIGILNIVVPLLFIPTLGMHCVKTGGLAWNGAYTFWVVGVSTAMQLNLDAFCLFRVVAAEPDLD